MGIPFVPVQAYAGSDIMKRRPQDFTSLEDPFRPGERWVIARSLNPDVALFHGIRGDRKGNVLVENQEAFLLAKASKKVIVTVDELVDKLVPEEPLKSFIPAMYVAAVVHVPHGAYPTGCAPFYKADEAELQAYTAAAKAEETFRAWLDREVFAFRDHEEYLAAKGLARTPAGAVR